MTVARVAGHDFDLTASSVERAVVGSDPEPIQEHYAIVAGRRYPPKQVLAATGLDRAFAGTGGRRRCGVCPR